MIKIIPLPAYDDNYIWLIHNLNHAVVIDPGDADPVLQYLNQEQLQLSAILITHHHPDHTSGIGDLRAEFDVPVYGPSLERINMMSHPLSEGDEIDISALGLHFKILDIPGHTSGHIAYYGANSLFCGDTLFGCGCGRLFEGTAAQMHASLNKLAALPNETQVFCAHEYTLSNIRFAKILEPHNADLINREAQDQLSRSKNTPTLPSTIQLEKLTNPFLRCQEASVIHAASQKIGHTLSNTIEVFTVIRDWKNHFK